MKLLFNIFIALCLYSCLTLHQRSWYSKEVMFSDWRKAGQVDFSTNKIVSDFYSGGNSKYFRQEGMKEFHTRLDDGDTLTLGTDYYCLTPISGQYLTEDFRMKHWLRWANGEVIVFNAFRANGRIVLEEVNNTWRLQ